MEEGDCLTHVVVSGKKNVKRLVFESKLQRSYVIGDTANVVDLWSTVNKDGKCMTGIHGIYEKTNEDDVRLVKAIGFYFESETVSPTQALENTAPNTVATTSKVESVEQANNQ